MPNEKRRKRERERERERETGLGCSYILRTEARRSRKNGHEEENQRT
jgi:hypothetical protein